MKIVYIAHPISGDVKGNIEKVLKLVRSINIKRADVLPFAPYIVDLQALDDSNPIERQRGMSNNIKLFDFVDEVWVFADVDRISMGVKSEIELAHLMNIPVLYNPKF